MAIVRRSLLMLVLTLYTSFAAGPFVWAAMMSLRTTTEIHRNHFAFPNPAHWEKFPAPARGREWSSGRYPLRCSAWASCWAP